MIKVDEEAPNSILHHAETT